LRSVGYDDAAGELEIEFQTGRVYRFSGVPASVHAWLMRSSAMGGLFNRIIRDRYSARDVTVGSSEPEDLADALRRSLKR
jgi:hypothetical protein